MHLGHAGEAQGANLEIVNDALAIEEVVGCGEEVPVQRFAPRIPPSYVLFTDVLPLQREKRGDLTVHQSLTKHDQDDHVGVSHEEKD